MAQDEMIGLDCLFAGEAGFATLTTLFLLFSGSSDDPDPDRIESGLANREGGGGSGGGGGGGGHPFRSRGSTR